MLDFFRRILWLAPKFFAVAVALFALYSQASGEGGGPQPLFFNPSPVSASSASSQALQQLRDNQPGALQQINHLGACFVLHAIPRQGTLDLETRARLVLALEPIRSRMGLDRTGHETARLPDDLTAEGLIFWSRFVEERSLDFTPQARSRIIKRLLSDRRGLKSDDLRILDTYALPALVEALGRVENEEDIRRVRKISQAVARLAGPSYALGPESTLNETKDAATRIRRYWDVAGPSLSQHPPIGRAYQTLVQTEFLVWANRTVRRIVGLDQSPLRARAKLDWSRNGALYLTAAVSAVLGGPLVALGLAQRALSRRERRRSKVSRLLLVGLLGTTLGLVSTINISRAAELVCSAFLGALTSAFVLDRELRERFDFRMIRILGQRRPPERAVAIAYNLAPAIPTLLPLILFEAVAIPLCFPSQGQEEGFRRVLVSAFQSGDVEYLMFVSLFLGLATAFLQIAADALLSVAAQKIGDL